MFPETTDGRYINFYMPKENILFETRIITSYNESFVLMLNVTRAIESRFDQGFLWNKGEMLFATDLELLVCVH